jgi:predicted AAA+ superfamily ATPase
MNMNLDTLEQWNPWWNTGEVPREQLGLPRNILTKLHEWLEHREILTLVGVRRAGKSAIVYQVIQGLLDEGVSPDNVFMANLEDPRFEGIDLGEILSTYRQGKGPKGRTYVFLDEVQASENWQRWLLVDYEQKKDVRFVVTGSSSSLVRGELARLLTGRTVTIPVHPLSFGEFLKFRGVDLALEVGSDQMDIALHQLERYLELGGFPEVVRVGKGSSAALLTQYFDAILYRDVIHTHTVDPGRLESLARFLLANVGTPQSLRSMARSTGLSVETVKSYLRHLEEAHLVTQVEHLSFKTKPKAREHHPAKYYCVDTGLRNTVTLRPTPDIGRLVENVVCSELVRRQSRPHYWRGRHEVDFVQGLRPELMMPINVCYGDEVPEREYAGIEEFRTSVRGDVGQPLLLTRAIVGTIEGIEHMPVWQWLLEGDG